MKYGLSNDTINKIINVFSDYPEIESVIIYGSRAKGNYKPGSDIDLTVKGKKLSLSLMNKIALTLDDLLMPYTIDLSVYTHIKQPSLLDHIRRNGIEFYNKNNVSV
jgi:predicted nucleotidyltransferase